MTVMPPCGLPLNVLQGGPVLEIDLGRVAANFRALRHRYAGRVLSSVVKNNGYGLGIKPLVRALAAEGCTHFWVLDLAEGAMVKQAAPQAQVFALHGLQGEAPASFAAAGITPVLLSLGEVERCAGEARKSGRKHAVAIQLDTGLGRLGLNEADVRKLADERSGLSPLDIKAWVTHLAAFDLPDAKSNRVQRECLQHWLRDLPPAPISLASSAGLYMGADWHFDIARVGSALYGVQTSTAWQDGLAVCYRLSAPILRICNLARGARIGYRGISFLDRPSVIATAMIGYGNGLPQAFAAHAAARIGEHELPIVGGIAMNLTMLDATDAPAALVRVGERAVFLDERQTVDRLAARLGCAPNAVLTQIGAGTRRVYVRNGLPVES